MKPVDLLRVWVKDFSLITKNAIWSNLVYYSTKEFISIYLHQYVIILKIRIATRQIGLYWSRSAYLINALILAFSNKLCKTPAMQE